MPFHEAQQALLRLPGIVDAIISEEDGQPTAVHVVATSGSEPEHILLAAMTALAQSGVDLDEENVHVTIERTQQASDAVLEELEHEGRVRLLSWNLQVTEEQSLAEVELQQNRDVALGRATARGAGQAPELLARACLDAIERLVLGRVALRLVGFTRTSVGGHDVVCVVLQETQGRTERTLVGAALGAEETGRAGAYAVLDAVNRRLGVILASPTRDYDIR
jgi:hypothetical protein